MRRRKLPVTYVRHNSTRGDGSGFQYKPILCLTETEPEFVKRVNSGFIDTKLEEWLCERGYETIALTRLTTDHCIPTTIQMDENHGFDVFVVADATAIFDGTLVEDYFDAEVIPRAAFAQFFDEYAISMSTEDAIWNI